jgi:hypothetical protein
MSVSQCPLDLVHSDVWGPAPFALKGGHPYYIIWLYFMTFRNEVLSIYKCFVVMVHTRFSTPIHVFRAAGEYISKMLCVLPEHGTLA